LEQAIQRTAEGQSKLTKPAKGRCKCKVRSAQSPDAVSGHEDKAVFDSEKSPYSIINFLEEIWRTEEENVSNR